MMMLCNIMSAKNERKRTFTMKEPVNGFFHQILYRQVRRNGENMGSWKNEIKGILSEFCVVAFYILLLFVTAVIIMR